MEIKKALKIDIKPFYQSTKKRCLLLSCYMMLPHQKPNKEVSMNISEDSRLEEFRQLKNTVRGSTEHLIIGIDIAKEKHHAFVGTATGKTLLRKLIFENTREGFEKLSAYVDAVKTGHTLPKAIFGLEPTGDYHKPLAEYLVRQGHTLVLEAGASVRKNRELLDGRWDKHDTKDAANVADLISQGNVFSMSFPLPT
jgi:hypothetical protein